jgi:lysophospholipase L1-like esterase
MARFGRSFPAPRRVRHAAAPVTVDALAGYHEGVARAQNGQGPLKVLTIGDSISEGQGTRVKTNRWQDQLNVDLRQALGFAPGGDGFHPGYYATYSPTTWGPAQSGVVTSGSPSQQESFGLGGRGIELVTAGDQITYTVTGDNAEIWWTMNGGIFTYSVDGGTPVSVNTAGSYSQHHVTSVSLGTAGSHTVAITATTAPCVIEGVYVYNGDLSSGIHFYDGTHTGVQSDFFQTTAIDTPQAYTAIAPDLVILELVGMNDFLNSYCAPTQTALNVATAITQLDALAKVPSIIMVIPWTPDATSPNSLGYTWAQYVTAIRGVITAPNITILDFSASWGTAFQSGLWDTDGLHPSEEGSGVIAQTLLGMLAPAPPATPQPVQTGYLINGGGATTETVTMPSNVEAGDQLILFAGAFDSTFSANAVISTVTGGGTWSKAIAHVGGGGTNYCQEIWYCLAATGGATTVTITYTAATASTTAVALIQEHTCITGLDQTGGNTGLSTSWQAPSITPTKSNELVFIFGGTADPGGAIDWPGQPWLADDRLSFFGNPYGTGHVLPLAWTNDVGAVTEQPGWTQATADAWQSVGASFTTIASGTPASISVATGGLVGSFLGSMGATTIIPTTGGLAAAFLASGGPTVGSLNATGGVAASFLASGSASAYLPTSGGLASSFLMAGTGAVVPGLTGGLAASFVASSSPLVVVPTTGGLASTFLASSSPIVKDVLTGGLVSTFLASGTGAVVPGLTGGLLASFLASGSATVVDVLTGGVVASFLASGSAGVNVPATGGAVATFLMSGSPFVAGVFSAPLVASFLASGGGSVTVPLTGGLAAAFLASSSPIVKESATASLVATFAAAGFLVNEVTAGLIASFLASGTGSITDPLTGGLVASFLASGTATVLGTQVATGALQATFTASGAPTVIVPTTGGLVASVLMASSPIVKVTASGGVVASFTASGTAGLQFPVTGGVVASFLASGAGTSRIIFDGGSGVVASFLASGAPILRLSATTGLLASFTANGLASSSFVATGGLAASFAAHGTGTEGFPAAGTVFATFGAGGVPAIQFFYIGRQSFASTVQPAMTFVQQSPAMTVQPALN